jgi:hypothetical protein
LTYTFTPPVIVTPPSCATIVSPADVATGIAATATLNWASGGGAPTGYKLYFGTDNPPTNIVNGTNLGAVTTYDPTPNMNYSTIYYWKVVAYNANGDATGCPVWSFTTMADPTISIFPYSESFDGATFAPTGWTNVKTAGTGAPGIWDRQTTGTNPTCNTHSGAAMARYNCYSLAIGTKGELSTPPIAFPNDNHRVKFWFYRDASAYPTDADLINVYYNTTNSSSGATLLGTINRSTTLAPVVASQGWYEYTYNMPVGSTGSGRYIVFEAVSAFGDNLFLDDITIEAIPATPIFSLSPSSKAYGNLVSGNTSASQTFTISNIGGGTLTITSGNISLSGTDPGQFTLTDGNTYPINLTSGQSANVSVAFAPTSAGSKTANLQVVHNAAGSPSTAALTGTALPAGSLFESFEGVTFPPAGWSVDASTWTQSVTTAYDGTKSAYYYPVVVPTDKKLITPKVTIASGNSLTYYAKTGSGVNQTIQVKYSVDKTSWTNIGTPVLLTTTFTQYSVDLTSLAGNNYYLAFSATSTSSYVSFYVDLVSGPVITQEAPSCAAIGLPADGSSNISTSSTLTWSDGGTGGIPAGYHLYFGTNGGGITDPSNIENGTLKTSPYTPAATLSYNTTYYWKVVPFNDNGSATGCSIWSFTTGGPQCTETATASGQDDDPTEATISSFPCTGGGNITAMTLDGTIGSNCGTWYDYNIIVNGTEIETGQCTQTGYDLSAYLPISSVTLQSVNLDSYSDDVTLTLTLHISYEEAACPAPTSLSEANVGLSSADLSWTENGTATLWDIEYGIEGFTPTGNPSAGFNNITDNTNLPLTGLSSATSYTWYVRADCAGDNTDVSVWTSHTFITPCEASSVPYFENFDGVTAPEFPICMTVENTNLDTKEWTTNSTTYLSAPNSAIIGYNTDGTTAMNDWFFTNGLNLTSGTAYEISFVYRSASASFPEKLAVDWGNAPISTAMSGTPIFNNSNIAGGWFIGTATVTPATSGTYYFGFHGYSVADMFNLYVDDIKVVEVVAATVWSGALDNDWDKSGNWTNGIPSSTTNVTLPAGLTNYPTLTSVESCNNLLISSSATGTASILDNSRLVVYGTATIQRYLTGNSDITDTYDYHQVSIPLNADVTNTQFTGLYVYQFNPATQLWASMGNELNTPLDNNQGFMVFYPNTSTTINFVGQLNTGTFTAVTSTDAVDEFSLVPNPYPSAIDWDAVSGWTKTGHYNYFYIWDPTGNNYVAWGSGAGQGEGTPAIGTAATGIIPVGQSFFVKSNLASSVLTMTNSVRVHNSQAFYKQTDNTVPEVFRLKVSDLESNDQMIVRFAPEAGIDRGNMDIDKLYGGENAPQLYSLAGNIDKLTINALNHSLQTIVVPVGLEYSQDGQLEFNASGFESFESSVTIFLEDKLLNKMIDLRETPAYTFTHSTGNDALRFNLHFFGVNSVPALAAKDYNIWSTVDHLNIHIPALTGQKAIVELYDLLGHLVLSQQVNLGTPTQIAVPQFNGMGIVRVIANSQVFSEKVFIR